MAYTKKTWAAGSAGNTPITATELNRMEDGISSSATINPKEYGAVGDGVADDTAALHAARDAAALTGAEVYVPEGTYLTTGLILNVVGQKWRLAHNAIIKKTGAGTDHTIAVNASRVEVHGGTLDGATTHNGVMIGSDLSDILISDVTIQNAYYGVRSKGGVAPITTRVTVRDCRIVSPVEHGVFFNWDTTNSLIEGNTIINTGVNGNGVWVGNTSTGCRILGNRIIAPGRMGIEVWGDCDGVVVSDNIISAPGSFGISIDQADHVTVNGNVLLNPTAYGIEFAGVTNGTISANAISGTSGIGIALNTFTIDNKGVSIVGNVLDGCTDVAIKAAGSGGTSDDISIVGNVFRNGSQPAVTIDPSRGKYWTISGNTIHYSTTAPHAITIGGGGHSVTGNTMIYDAAITTAGGYALYISDSGNTITGNRIVGNEKLKKGVFCSASCAVTIVANNVISGTTEDLVNAAAATAATNIVQGNIGSRTLGNGYSLHADSKGVGNVDNSSVVFSTAATRFAGIGFFGTTPVTTKPTVTGSRGGNAALASLLTTGATLGLWTDSTTA